MRGGTLLALFFAVMLGLLAFFGDSLDYRPADKNVALTMCALSAFAFVVLGFLWLRARKPNMSRPMRSG